MHTDKTLRVKKRGKRWSWFRLAIIYNSKRKSSFSLSVFICVHLWFQEFFPPRLRLQRRDRNNVGDIFG
jgi:hypothetical protein